MAVLKRAMLGAAVCLTPSGAASAAPLMGLGRVATDAEIAGWNIDVAPDGKAMPIGGSTVDAGEKVYQANCAACHGLNLEGGLGPALTGGIGTLATAKPLKTVQSYWPYATTLFDYIRRAMPFQAPQTLNNDDVYAVTGYVLYANKLMDANARVDAKSLVGVKMPNRDRFYVDDRPDAKNSRCMKNCLKRQSSR